MGLNIASGPVKCQCGADIYYTCMHHVLCMSIKVSLSFGLQLMMAALIAIITSGLCVYKRIAIGNAIQPTERVHG